MAATITGTPSIHHLAAHPSSVPEARRLALELAGDLMPPGQRYKLQLTVTEVVANAVPHSGSADQIKLTLTPKERFLGVRVTDGGEGLVPRPGALSADEGSGIEGAGQGLFIVEQLTRRWGVTREDGNTRVWFELDYEERAPDQVEQALAPEPVCAS